MNSPSTQQQTPLCVDLDKTLLCTDTLYEGVLLLFRKNPLYLFLIMIWWLSKGRAYCKQMVANRVNVGEIPLPFNKPLVAWLEEQKQSGRRLVLVTAADRQVAHAVNGKLQLFDEVIASDGTHNLKGKNKRDVLIQKYGERGFDYAGDCAADLMVWAVAKQAIVVSRNQCLIEKVKTKTKVAKVFRPEAVTLKTFSKTIRVHQYAKNVLIFFPWLLGHDYTNFETILACILAFISFSLLASSVYVLNDLIDLSSDRTHRTKQFRPLACGLISIPKGIFIFLACFIVSWLIALTQCHNFQMVLAGYFVLTLLYSLWLKQLLLVDVLVLSSLYTVRLFAGMVVIGSELSEWLLLFSLFLFTSLAFLKRYTELYFAKRDNVSLLKGRGYHTAHIAAIKMFGISSGYLSVLVLALYLNSAKALQLYKQPMLLFLACPVFVYWISRLWLIAVDGKMDDDPVVFAVKDKITYIVAAIILVIGILATV